MSLHVYNVLCALSLFQVLLNHIIICKPQSELFILEDAGDLAWGVSHDRRGQRWRQITMFE